MTRTPRASNWNSRNAGSNSVDRLDKSHVERRTDATYDQSAVNSSRVDESAPTISSTPTPSPAPSV
jgi:hypothetical protein